MAAIKQNKSITCKCSPKECQDIEKEVNNAFVILTDPGEIRRRARLFKGLGHEVRLRILGLLAVQELCTCEIVGALEGATSTIVHHLRILAQAGLTSSRRVGKFTFFRLNNDVLKHHRVFDEVNAP